MNGLINARKRHAMSQRQLAHSAGIAYKTLQLIEGEGHDPRVSTLTDIASTLGYPTRLIRDTINRLFQTPTDSVEMISYHILNDGFKSWKIWLFNFVDAFRKNQTANYITDAPDFELDPRVLALLTSTVEMLCSELKIDVPTWCRAIDSLDDPWFPSGSDALKPLALVESPIHFRKRNVFVLGNFLDRA